MKFLNLLFLILFTFTNTYAQSKPQKIQKLEVESLALPKVPVNKVLTTDGENKVKESDINASELNALSGAHTDETIQEQIDSTDALLDAVNSRTSNLDNTSDANKPVSIATQTALDAKANDSAVVHKTGNESISGVKTFTGKILASSTTNGSKPCPDMTDAQMLAVASPGNGECVNNTDKKAWFIYDSVGLKWKALGSGSGQGGINYITNYSFDDDIVGWFKYNDTPAPVPLDGSGGASSLTLSRETTSPLVPAGSLKVEKTATGFQGQGFSYDFTIDPLYKNSRMALTFGYKTTANYADNDIRVFLYDRTAGTIIYADTPDIKKNDNGGIHYTTFRTTSNTSYRAIFHYATASSLAYDFYLDNVSFGPEDPFWGILNIENGSGWQSYTPTFNGLGTPTSVNMFWRRSGPNLEIYGTFWSGTVTASQANFSYPLINGNYPVTSMPTDGIIGIYGSQGSTASTHYLVSGPSSPGIISFGSDNWAVKQAGTGIGTSSINTVRASIPIAGWAATNPNFIGVPDIFSMSRLNSFVAQASTAVCNSSLIEGDTNVGKFTTCNYGTVSNNTRSGCTSAPAQTVASMQNSGIQLFSKAYNATSTCASPAMVMINIGRGMKGVTRAIYKNDISTTPRISGELSPSFVSTTFTRGTELNSYNETTGILVVDFGYQGASTSTHDIFFADNSGQANGFLTVDASKAPVITGQSFSNIQARAGQNNSQSIPSSTWTAITYNMENFDTHNALSSAGVFTAPETGYYKVDSVAMLAGAVYTTSQSLVLSIFKNGAIYSAGQNFYGNGAALTPGAIISDVVYLVVGETIDVRVYQNTGIARNILNDTNYTHTSIHKIGF